LGLRVGASLHLLQPDTHSGSYGFATVILLVFFSLNLLLGVFNLLPVPPLDGSSAIMLLMSENQARGYLNWTRGGTFAIPGILVSLIIFRYIFPPVESFIKSLLL
jgi:Zn-dependent protease